MVGHVPRSNPADQAAHDKLKHTLCTNAASLCFSSIDACIVLHCMVRVRLIPEFSRVHTPLLIPL
jgi:hypothetical protein